MRFSIVAAVLFAVAASAAPSPQRADFTVHQYAAPEAALFVNGYVIETPRRLIVVDATLTRSSATAFRRYIAGFAKPVAAYVVTHAHPDHYNGLRILAGNADVPIYASADVLASIKAIDAAKAKQWTPVFKDEWPADRRFPSMTLPDNGRFTVDGVTMTLRAIGPAESHADSIWIASGGGKRAAFVGDLVFNGTHSYMCDGHTARWLDQLGRLRREAADERWSAMYPGHGPAVAGPGIAQAIVREARYLQLARRFVAGYGANGPTEVQKDALIRDLAKASGAKGLEFMIDACAAPLAADVRAAK